MGGTEIQLSKGEIWVTKSRLQECAHIIQPGSYRAEIKEPGAHHLGYHGFPNRHLLRTPKFSNQMFLRPHRLYSLESLQFYRMDNKPKITAILNSPNSKVLNEKGP